MKKIALLLAFVFIFTAVLTACDKGTDQSATEQSGDNSATESGTVTPISNSTNVSVGKKYETAPSADKAYQDSYTSELTDGLYATGETVAYSNPKFSGYSCPILKVVIDLNEDSERLYKFEVSYICTTAAGVNEISSATVYVSDDKTSWKRVGFAKKQAFVEGTTKKAILELKEPVNAKYVRFDITKQSSWMFLDEVSVYADIAGTKASVEYLSLLNEAYNKDNLTNEQKLAELTKVFGKEVDRSKPRINVSEGCTYTSSYDSSTGDFADNGKKLTDTNTIGSQYEQKVWSGYEGGEQLDIVIQLLDERDDLADFVLSMYNRPATGIMVPTYVDVSVSTDGTTYTLVGRVYGSSNINQTNYNFTLGLKQGVKGKFVKFTLAKTPCTMFLIEEASVYIYSNENFISGKSMYPAVNFPEVTEKTYWDASTPDYKKNINLVLNKPYQISSRVTLNSETEAQYNDPISKLLLTDGEKSTNTSYNNGYWFRTHTGVSRSVYFDLENSSTITGFAANFLSYTDYGINIPGFISLYLSDDGVNWYNVNTTNVASVGKDGIAKVNVKLKKAVQARFARVTFDVGVHCYLDEIEVFGTKFVATSTPTPAALGYKDETTGNMVAPSKEILGGVKDVMLAYHTSDSAVLTKEVFLSYVGYLDKDNKVLDTMFDGYLFLPTVSRLPSGAMPYEKSIKSDWEWVLDNVFQDGRNLKALNEAVGEVKAALNKPDYKVKVFYTLLYPTTTVTDFGDVDGDGKSEDFSNYKDRIKAIDWYMNQFIKRFKDANFENLEFNGFYWFHETINGDQGEKETLTGVSNLIHKKGYQFFWIPYYSASGYYHWKDYGFDVVCLQPNYAFTAEASFNQIKSAANLIKLFSMCIEIEMNGAALSDDTVYYQRYMDYLRGGVIYGYMTGSIHMYYQDVANLYTAQKSPSKRIRLLYDYTYQFIKGTLNIHPDKLADLSFDAKSGTIFEGKLFEPDDNMAAALSVSAENGTVSVNADGTFRYYPNKGFTGKDTFTFKICTSLDWSADTVVTINVG